MAKARVTNGQDYKPGAARAARQTQKEQERNRDLLRDTASAMAMRRSVGTSSLTSKGERVKRSDEYMKQLGKAGLQLQQEDIGEAGRKEMYKEDKGKK
ncbi:MAG TPA: hypothetical protein VII99_10570 [Bacteroidia bacterium]